MCKRKGSVLLKDFCFTFLGKDGPFLKNINLSINKGKFTVLVGPSSCGKSTLALCLIGLYLNVLGGKTSGKIEIGGLSLEEAKREDITTKASIVFQDPDIQFCSLFAERRGY